MATTPKSPNQVVVGLTEGYNKRFELYADGSCWFADDYDEDRAFDTMLPVFNFKNMTGFTLYGCNGMLTQATFGHIEFGADLVDPRMRSLFSRLASVKVVKTIKTDVCECGATKCGLPRHSDWCPIK